MLFPLYPFLFFVYRCKFCDLIINLSPNYTLMVVNNVLVLSIFDIVYSEKDPSTNGADWDWDWM